MKELEKVETQIHRIPFLADLHFKNFLNEELVFAARINEKLVTPQNRPRHFQIQENPEILLISKMGVSEKRLLNMALQALSRYNILAGLPLTYRILDQDIYHFHLSLPLSVPKLDQRGNYQFSDFYLHRFQNLLVVTTEEKLMEQTLLLIQDPTSSKSIHSTFPFQEAQKNISNQQNFLYLDNNRLFREFYNLEKHLDPQQLIQELQLTTLLLKQPLNFNGCSTLVAYWDPQTLMRESRFHLECVLGLDFNHLSEYHRILYAQDEQPFEITKVLPESSALMRAYRTDPEEEWNLIYKELKKRSYSFFPYFEQILKVGNQGFSHKSQNFFRNYLLPRFGSDYAFVTSYRHVPEEKIQQSGPYPYIAMVFEFPSIELHKELIQFFVSGVELNGYGKVQEEMVRNNKAFIFPSFNFLLVGVERPCIGFIGPYLVFASDIEYYKNILDVYEERSASLHHIAHFETAGGLKTQNLLLYLQMKPLTEILKLFYFFWDENNAQLLQIQRRQEINRDQSTRLAQEFSQRNPQLSQKELSEWVEKEIDRLVLQQFQKDFTEKKNISKKRLDSLDFLNTISASLLMKTNKLVFSIDFYLNPD